MIIERNHTEMSSRIKQGSGRDILKKYSQSYTEALKGSKETSCWVTQS